MNFCEKCNSVLVATKEKEGFVYVCRKCGYRKKEYEPIEISETVEHKPRDNVVVLEKDETTLPKTKTNCPKCGHKEALWWLQQTRSVDEAPTLFLRCTSCKHSWREYG